MFYKTTELTEQGRVERYFNTSKGIKVKLVFSKDKGTLLLDSVIRSKAKFNKEQYKKINVISPSIFEEAMKKAINHFLRQNVDSDYLLVDKRNLDRKLKIEYKYSDEPIIVTAV